MSFTSESSSRSEEALHKRLFAIAHDLAETAKRETSRTDFFRAWLSGILAATGADSGTVIETTTATAKTLVALGSNIFHAASDDFAARRDQARRGALERRQFVWVREETAKSFPADGVSDLVTLLAPLPTTDRFAGVLELSMSAAVSAGRQRACIEFIVQSSAYVEDFMLREEIRSLSSQKALCEEALEFVSAANAHCDRLRTAYAIANEARRLVGCDRVTVLLRRGRRYRVVAISGQDTFDLRSPEIKLLAVLTERVAATDRPFSSEDPGDSIPPPLDEALSAYVDESHVKSVAVFPLRLPQAEAEKNDVVDDDRPRLPLGALVFESRAAKELAFDYTKRSRFVADHAAPALANALEQEGIFLLPLWKGIGRAFDRLRNRSTRFKVAAAVAALGLAIAALVFIPADFALHASATFQPIERLHVFAPLDGTVATLNVKHGERVAAGDSLLELRNIDLEVALSEMKGDRTAAAEQLASVERSLFGEGEQITVEERVRLSGQRSELTRRIESADEKLRLLESKRESLRVASPIAGEVITWNIERLLRNRPVQQGQVLLTVADTTHAWELEAYLPEHYVGHLSRAQHASSVPLQVRFRPTSDPSQEFTGVVKEIDEISEIRGDYGNTVLVTVAFDPAQLPQLKPGLEASAKVMCGTRSLGYVWFHDLVDFIQARVLFRIF